MPDLLKKKKRQMVSHKTTNTEKRLAVYLPVVAVVSRNKRMSFFSFCSCLVKPMPEPKSTGCPVSTTGMSQTHSPLWRGAHVNPEQSLHHVQSAKQMSPEPEKQESSSN